MVPLHHYLHLVLYPEKKNTSSARKHVIIAPTLQAQQNVTQISNLGSTTSSSTKESVTSNNNYDRTGIDDSFKCQPEIEYDPAKPNDYIELAAKRRLQAQLEERDQQLKDANNERRNGQSMLNSSKRMTGTRGISNLPAWMTQNKKSGTLMEET